MRNQKRFAAVLLCAVLLCTLLLSSVCIVRAANHACRGECCLVCSLIARVEQLLHGLVTLLPAAAGCGLMGLAGVYRRAYPMKERPVYSTPVSWKTRLND